MAGKCENCGHSECYGIPKGMLKEEGLKKEECSKCGVRGHIIFDPFTAC